MADEATVRSALIILKTSGNLRLIDYPAANSEFRVTVTGTKGPTPGALTIPVGGKVIVLDELVTPGLCRIVNRDEDNFVTFGMWDQSASRFYPMFEVGPGEAYVFKFSRDVREEYTNTGTGTTGLAAKFFAKANTAACSVSVEAFEA